MRRRLQIPALAGWGAFLAAGALSCAMLCVAPAGRPQAATGDDALSVAFGDARRTISAALVHKADSYYHGGVEMDGGHHCDHGHAHGDHDHAQCDHGHCDHDHDHAHCDHDHDHEEHAPQAATSGDRTARRAPDPWRWINDRVRAPQVERHLEGRRAVEMIPLLWASVRADPKNIDAWTTAWYIANRTMRDAELAEKILDEGLRRNPDEPELLFTRARGILSAKGDRSRARELMLKARAVLQARCGGQVEKLSPADAETWRHLGMFLKNLL